MDTQSSSFRACRPLWLLAGLLASLFACLGTARADTLYTLQVQAGTTQGGSHFAFFFPFTNSDIPLAQSASYVGPAMPIIGTCCSGSYGVDGVASDAHGGTASASASGTGAFTGSTETYDPLAGQIFGFAQSAASVTSFFKLVGPSSTTPIGVLMSWELSAASDGSGSAYANLDVFGGFGNGVSVFDQTLTSVFASNITGGLIGGLSVVELFPNAPYRVTATARAADSSTSFGAPYDHGSGSAFVDPLFSLPEAYQGEYQLVGLPTAAAIAPVPEPAVTLLLAAGLGMIGFKSRATRAAARSAMRRS